MARRPKPTPAKRGAKKSANRRAAKPSAGRRGVQPSARRRGSKPSASSPSGLSAVDAARLARMRDAMDALNLRLAELFDARLRAACAVVRWKSARNLPTFDPRRESAMLARLAAAPAAKDGFSKAARTALFRALFKATRAALR
jgi:chorismate mutase